MSEHDDLPQARTIPLEFQAHGMQKSPRIVCTRSIERNRLETERAAAAQEDFMLAMRSTNTQRLGLGQKHLRWQALGQQTL